MQIHNKRDILKWISQSKENFENEMTTVHGADHIILSLIKNSRILFDFKQLLPKKNLPQRLAMFLLHHQTEYRRAWCLLVNNVTAIVLVAKKAINIQVWWLVSISLGYEHISPCVADTSYVLEITRDSWIFHIVTLLYNKVTSDRR